MLNIFAFVDHGNVWNGWTLLTFIKVLYTNHTHIHTQTDSVEMRPYEYLGLMYTTGCVLQVAFRAEYTLIFDKRKMENPAILVFSNLWYSA